MLTESRRVESDDQFQVDVGHHKTLILPKRKGLKYFPDQPLVVIKKQPLTFLLVANNGFYNGTFILQGKDFRNARPKSVLLKPTAKTFDNGYAGCGAVYHDKAKNEWICLYHAEDHENQAPVEYNTSISSAYWSIGMLTVDGTTQKTKTYGQVLTGAAKKNPKDHRGIGDVSITPDATGKYLYAYYTDLNRLDRLYASICMARCEISEGGQPGQWKKFYLGKFSEDGLGGKESSVVTSNEPSIDVIGPHVSYVPEMGCYFMVCNLAAYSDMERKKGFEKSGIAWCYSLDGIEWSKPKLIVEGLSVPFIGRNYTGHPSLYVERADSKEISGRLLYCYSPSWGTRAPHSPHYLAGRTISFRLNGQLKTPVKSEPVPTIIKPMKPIAKPAVSPKVRKRVLELRAMAKNIKLDENGRITEGDLSGIPLNQSDMQILLTLTELKVGSLRNTKFRDEYIHSISKLLKVEELDLSENPITDVSVEEIGKIKTLRKLKIEKTRISQVGYSKLKRLLPTCTIIYSSE